MIFSAPPFWLPSLTQPADWFVSKILVILILIGLVAIVLSGPPNNQGGGYGKGV